MLCAYQCDFMRKGSKLRVFAKLLTYSFLCDFRLKTMTVKKYYSAVYDVKVGLLCCITCLFFTR